MNALTFEEREPFCDEERELFCADLKETCLEYFEGCERFSVDLTRTEKGLSVCLIFDASRIKKFKRPH